MLDLKPYLATHTFHQIHQRKRNSAINLPSEILDLILEILYNDGGQLGAIAPASQVSRQFRKSAVPIMFRETSCVIRENDGDRSRHSYIKDLDIAPLLQHVKTLCIRKALRTNDNDVATPPEQLEAFRCHDLESLRHKISHMEHLQLVRYVQNSTGRFELAAASRQIGTLSLFIPPRSFLHRILSCNFLFQWSQRARGLTS